MNSSDINKKINKYQLKMNNTADSKKRDLYNQKINHYKLMARNTMQRGGDSSLLQNAISKQQQEVLSQIEKIKSSFNSDSVMEQINEAAKSSNFMGQFDNLGQEVRDSVGSYANSFKEIMNELEGITQGEVNIDVDKIMGSIQLPGSVDELIINSLARDIISGKDVSDELNLYGISESDPNLTAAVEKMSGTTTGTSNTGTLNTGNILIPQTEGEEPFVGSEESVVPGTNTGNSGTQSGGYFRW